MESTTIGGRRWGDACPRPLFFVPGISPANRSYFARFPFFASFQKSKDCISTRLPHPSRHFSAICGYPAGRAAGRRRARSASEAYRTARQFEAWVRLGQPRSGRRPPPLGGETHGVGQAFGDRQTTKGGPPSKYQYGGPSSDFGAGHPPSERRGHGRAGHGRHVHLRGLRRELEAELAKQ